MRLNHAQLLDGIGQGDRAHEILEDLTRRYPANRRLRDLLRKHSG
jgi:hypothetical protein